MSRNTSRTIRRLLALGIATLILMLGTSAFAQDDGAAEESAAEAVVMEEVAGEELALALTAEEVQTNLNQVWLLLAGFLVFFMQLGFAMLEGGFIRHTGVVNSLAENFIDATVTGIMFFIVGYGIAYADTSASLIFSMPALALGGIDGTQPGDGFVFIDFFFQFAFAGAAATIATGAMAERTNFVGKLIYSAILGGFAYPVVVFWTWGGGWLAEMGYLDFAGSGIVHQFGGVVALMGALFVGARVGRVFGSPPRPSNMALATLGTFVLWFGWYGFNVGSTLAAEDPNALGLVTVNTTLAAAAGSLGAMFFQYIMTRRWDLPFMLNGSLAGLVAITAGCAFVSPMSAIIIGLIGGVVVVISVDLVERAKVDDAVGAFSVHGACGALGVLAIGLWGIPELTGTAGGLFMGGGLELLGIQAVGVLAITLWAMFASGLMFGALRLAGVLRMPKAAEAVGIDVYEHGASLWPDVLPIDEAAAPAGAGD